MPDELKAKPTMKLLEGFQVKMNVKRLRKRVLRSKMDCPEWIDELLAECLSKARPEPTAIYDFFKAAIDTDKNRIELAGQIFQSGFMVERFKRTEELGLMIVTIGSQVEDLAEEYLSENDALRGVVCDAIGSEYVESAADAVEKMIEEERGYCMSRFSPGYNDWDIREQTKLFSLIDSDKIGVTLNKSSLMKPEKSISAMIGLSDREIKRCGNCPQKDCQYRGLGS